MKRKTIIALVITIISLSSLSQEQKPYKTLDDSIFNVGDKIIVKPDNFMCGTASIIGEGYKVLINNDLYKFLTTHPNLSIEIGAHSVTENDSIKNQKATDKEAEYHLNELIEKGMPPKRIKAKGYGETKPLYTEKDLEGIENTKLRTRLYLKNTRIEIIITETR